MVVQLPLINHQDLEPRVPGLNEHGGREKSQNKLSTDWSLRSEVGQDSLVSCPGASTGKGEQMRSSLQTPMSLPQPAGAWLEMSIDPLLGVGNEALGCVSQEPGDKRQGAVS
jgi:hypothetical protein